jgi:hypothetical protein
MTFVQILTLVFVVLFRVGSSVALMKWTKGGKGGSVEIPPLDFVLIVVYLIFDKM